MNHRLTVTAAAATVLASVAMYPLIETTGWFFAGIGAVIVVAGAGTLTRLRALPAAVCLLATLAGLFLYLNLLFAGHESLLRVIPTRASVDHLIWLAERAHAETAKAPPPVPGTRGITLLAAGGIGIVAAATDLLAVRLRRPALAGLPLLVLFCVPLATDVKPGAAGTAVVFSLGIAGYLAILSADGRERVRLWGRLVHTWPDRPEARVPDTRQLAVAGRRVGFAAVVMALCVPLILPALQPHRLLPGSPSGSGAGGRVVRGAISLPNPLVQMNEQLRMTHPETVLTYRSTAAGSTPPYFQVYVLGRLGTNDWSMAPPSATTTVGGGTLPAAPGLTATTPAVTVQETISLSSRLRSGKNAVNYLPVPYAPRLVNVPGTWGVEPNSLSILTSSTSLAGLRYTVTSANVDPSPQQLRRAPGAPAAMGGYLSVPRPFRQLLPLTRKITAGQSSLYGKMVALQQWFTQPGNFTYSLDVPQTRGASALINFVTTTRRGYCQQFAFAMAVMARLLGVPSRVVVGYTQGVSRGNGAWLVQTSDAHAWPELYFSGAGWLRFEPTPSGSAGRAGQATASAPAYSALPLLGTVPTPSPTPSAPSPRATRHGPVPARGGVGAKLRHIAGTGAAGRASAPFPVLLLVVVLLALAAVTPWAVRFVTRRRRWFRASDDADRADAAWLEFRDDLADHRIAYRASESPRALARRLGTSLGLAPAAREALERIARAEERARYSRSPVASAQLRSDVATVRRAMARTCGLPARCAAVLLPASVLAPARAALTHMLDVFGWVDVVGASVHRRASARRAGAAQS
jgi:transglutaminase-like putative cysteine protease